VDDDIVTLRNTFAPLLPWVYMWRYSIGFFAKKIKGRSSRILGQESPHLKEWCREHLRAPGCYHGSVGQGWDVVEKYISSQNRSPDKKAL
jgi:putative transposase